jgi:hypothetical protein
MNTTNLQSAFPHPSARTITPAARAKKKVRPGMRAPTRVNITPVDDLAIDAKACQEPTKAAEGTTAPWPGNLHMVPNATARSALFGCARRMAATGTVYRERVLHSTDDHVLKYLGPDLDQNDAEVWQLALAWCRDSGKPMGQEVDFAFNDWCRVLGRSESSGHINDIIMQSLTRLANGTVTDDTKDQEDVFHLIQGAGRNKKTGKGYVKIDHRAAKWLGSDTSELHLRRKVTLKSNIAKWMHDHFSTSSTPYPMNLSTLRDISGTSQDLPLRTFRIRVLSAIEELQQCEPPLFGPESRVEKKSNGDYSLIVVKATNSRIVPPKRLDEAAPAVAAPAPVVKAPSQPVVAVRADYTPASRVPQSAPDRVQVNEYGEVDKRTAAEKQAARQRSRVAL